MHRRLVELVSIEKPNSARAPAGSVRGSGVEWNFRHNLGKMGWAPPDIFGKPVEVLHCVVEMGGEENLFSRLLDLALDPGKASHTAGDGKDHAAELAKQPLQLPLGAAPAAPREGIEQLQESLETVRRELDGARHRIDEPAEDHLDRLKRSVPLAEFLDGVGVLLPLAVVLVRRTKDLVNAVEEDAAQPAPSLLTPCASRMKSFT